MPQKRGFHTVCSPWPLVQAWQHCILRSPHDSGQGGTDTDAPCSRAVACEADRARTAVHRTQSRAALLILSLQQWPPPHASSAGPIAAAAVVPGCSVTPRPPCPLWTAFGAVSRHLPVPVGRDGARRDLAMGHQAPQGDQELPGQRHDSKLPQPGTPLPGALLIPPTEVAVWLPVHPAPCQYDHEPTGPFTTRFTDPLLALRLPGVIRRGRQ